MQLAGKNISAIFLGVTNPFNLPGKAVMRRETSFLSPGKFQGHCKMFVKVLR